MQVPHNINQDLQANIFYLKGEVNYLTSAIIKNAQGKNLMIEWGPLESRVQSPTIQEEKVQDIEFQNETPDKEEHKSEDKNTVLIVNDDMMKNQMNISGDQSETGNEEVINKESNENSSSTIEKVVEQTNEENELQENIVNSTPGGQSGSQGEVSQMESLQRNIKTYYGISTIEAYKFQLGAGGKIQKNGKWISASASELQKYFIPSTENIERYKFQFLNLASPAGIGEAEAKEYLSNKGILKGKEATFIEAAKKNNVNEIYLMAHACLETGNGTSKLATGVNYKGTVVYNMFGINAVDSDPIGQGAAYAYKMGWTTPEKAILGGAEFISTQYINNYPYNQDTLYEMRWNPASPGRHQYATDIAWATKQAERMEKIYASFNSAIMTFDIPVYRK